MKIEYNVLNLVMDVLGRTIYQMETMNIPRKKIICYIPGYIIQAIGGQMRQVTYTPIRNMVTDGITVFGVSVLPGYEQNKIIVCNSKSEIFPNCVRRIEINFEVDFKENVMPSESQHWNNYKISFTAAHEPYWKNRPVDLSKDIDRMTAKDFRSEYFNNPLPD